MFFICHYNGKVLHSGERAFFHPTKSNSPDLGFIIETNGKIPASAGKKALATTGPPPPPPRTWGRVPSGSRHIETTAVTPQLLSEEVNCVFLSVLALKVSQNVVKREFKR
jgi:hypothetical protein